MYARKSIRGICLQGTNRSIFVFVCGGCGRWGIEVSSGGEVRVGHGWRL